jgi:hypothetical protein
VKLTEAPLAAGAGSTAGMWSRPSPGYQKGGIIKHTVFTVVIKEGIFLFFLSVRGGEAIIKLKLTKYGGHIYTENLKLESIRPWLHSTKTLAWNIE